MSRPAPPMSTPATTAEASPPPVAAAGRSNPIAIAMARQDKHQDGSSSDEEETHQTQTCDVQVNALHAHISQLTVGSLPARPQRSGWSVRNNRTTLTQAERNGTDTDTGCEMARTMPVPRAPFLHSRNAPSPQNTTSMPHMELTEPAAAASQYSMDEGMMGIGTGNGTGTTLGTSISSSHPFPDFSVPSYGSLRDSHLEGRFLDGPASYRSGRSGRIHNLTGKSVIRFDDSATSYQPPSILERNKQRTDAVDPGSIASWSQPIAISTTVGERMEENKRRKQQQQQRELEDKPSSVGGASSIHQSESHNIATIPISGGGGLDGGGGILSAMFEGGQSQERSATSCLSTSIQQQQQLGNTSNVLPQTVLPTSLGRAKLIGRGDPNISSNNDVDVGMLSTSLTGLEILKNTRLTGQIFPQLQHQQQQQNPYLHNNSTVTATDISEGHPSQASVQGEPQPHVQPSIRMSMDGDENTGTGPSIDDPPQRPSSPLEEYHPDTDGAFDLEF